MTFSDQDGSSFSQTHGTHDKDAHIFLKKLRSKICTLKIGRLRDEEVNAGRGTSSEKRPNVHQLKRIQRANIFQVR